MNDFVIRCSELEKCFKSQAKKEASIYLPSIRPTAPVDFVLIGMEPSLKRWARDDKEAEEKINLGFKDFTYSIEDFILHYCVVLYLCSNDLTYYVTNLSKGAMTVGRAEHERQERYESWFPLLSEELKLVAKKSAKIIPIGKKVANFLRSKDCNGVWKSLVHYSSRAAKYRDKLIQGQECEFNLFKRSVSVSDIEKVAKVVIRNAGMDNSLAESTLERIRHSNLSESRKKLIFGYKVIFEHLRSQYKAENLFRV